MDNVAKVIGINKEGIKKGKSQIYDLEGSKEFGKVYSSLESNDDIEQLEDNNLLNIHSGSLMYSYQDKYRINIVADFDSDLYKVIISEL